MSLSHTGRNGTITESTQTTYQRAKYNDDDTRPNGKSDLLTNIFTGTPTGLAPATVGSDGYGADDRGKIFLNSHDDLFDSYKALIKASVTGGFGFGVAEAVSLSYDHSDAPTLDNVNKVAIVAGDGTTTDSDLRYQTEVLSGHPNLKVNGFSVETMISGSVEDVQITRNDDLPGSNVDMSRADTLGNYFTGAGLRN